MHQTIELTNEQRKAMELLLQGENVAVFGSAGTGKTELIKAFKEEAEINGKKIVITAFSGRAAYNAGGQTIHSFLRMGPKDEENPEKVAQIIEHSVDTLKDVDAIIVDEVSMVSDELFDLLINVCEHAELTNQKRIQIILCGDIAQAGPVGKRWFFEGKTFEGRFRICNLRMIQRQDDPEFLEQIRRVENRDYSGIEYFSRGAISQTPNNGLWLCPMNMQVDRINKERLDGLQNNMMMISPFLEGRSVHGTAEETICIKPGARVMTTKNCFKEGYQNGSIGTFIDYDEVAGKMRIEFNDGIKEIERSILREAENGKYLKQFPIRMAEAITIYKSQGLTIEKVNLLAEGIPSDGQLCTALTRTRRIEDLYVEGVIDTGRLRRNYRVENFRKKFDLYA